MHTFTILIPCYNAEQYIKRCLLSIIEQKEFIQFNVKIICANDGSTDNTLDVINSVAKSFPNQIKVVSDQNCGLSLTRQKLINLCDTEYFIHVDADDYLTSNSLRLYFDAMSHSNDLFIFRSYHQKENSRKRLNYVNKFIKKTDMNVNYYISHNMFYIWNIVISTNFYRSASFKYDHVKNIGEDYICLAYLFTLAKNIG
jgi:glycosyltransferase involved in cell wall biosynthesis